MCVCSYMCVYTYICIYVCIYVCVYIYMSVYAYICVYMCMYMYIICVCVRVCLEINQTKVGKELCSENIETLKKEIQEGMRRWKEFLCLEKFYCENSITFAQFWSSKSPMNSLNSQLYPLLILLSHLAHPI